MATPATAPPDATASTHPQRWAFALLLALLALALGCSGLPSPLYPIYQQQWDMSPLTITVIFAVYAIGALGAALTVGPISDAVGRKPVLITALVSILLGLALFLIANTAWVLMVARFLHGAAIGGGFGLAMSADFRVTCPEARFAANFTRLGFHPGFGLTVTLPEVIGQTNAARRRTRSTSFAARPASVSCILHRHAGSRSHASPSERSGGPARRE